MCLRINCELFNRRRNVQSRRVKSISQVVFNLDLVYVQVPSTFDCAYTFFAAARPPKMTAEWQLRRVIQQNELLGLLLARRAPNVISYWHTTTGVKVSRSTEQTPSELLVSTGWLPHPPQTVPDL